MKKFCPNNVPTPLCVQGVMLGLALLTAISFRSWYFGTDYFAYADSYKQLWAFSGLILAFLPALLMQPISGRHRIWILLLPFAATLPGAFFHQWHWNYNAYAEWINTGLAFAWVLLWVQLWRDPLNAARWAAILLVAGALITLAWSYTEWGVVQKFSSSPTTNFGNQNYATNFLVLIFPFLLVFASLRSGGRRWPWIAVAVALVAALIFVFKTRAALAGWAIASYLAAGIWMKTRSVRRRAWIAWFALPITFVVSAAIVSQYYWEFAAHVRYLELLGPHAWYSRVLPWMVGWQSVLDAPWIGHGPGASWSLYHGFFDRVPELGAVNYSVDYEHIHNDYLEWLQEGGVLGLASYLIVWGWIIWRALQVAFDARRDQIDRRLAGASAYGLLAYHLHSMAEVSAHMPVNRMALFMVGMIVLMLSSSSSAPPVRVASRWFRLIPALFLITVGFSLWKDAWRSRDTFMATYAPAIVELDDRWRMRLDAETDSVEAIYGRIVFKLFTMQTADGVDMLFDRMESRMPSFRNDKFLRFFHYLAEHQTGKPDSDKIGEYLRRAREGGERYHPAIVHFAAQFAAHMGRPELLLEVLEDRLFGAGVTFRVVRATRREDVRVRVDTEGDGFVMTYDENSRLTFVMGMPQLRLLMEIASEKMSEEEAGKRINAVLLKVRAAKEPVPGFRDVLERLTTEYVRGFAILATPPKIQ